MATRMQQRRGTAAQWLSTNGGNGPVLEAGEIGFESDTGKFKIGDGVNHWSSLDYFLDESEINNITDDYVLSSTLAQTNGVATLDGSGKLTSSQIPTSLASTTYVDNAVSGLVDSAPGLLNTLNELAAAVNDDPTFFTTVATNLSNHEADTTNIHGIANTADLATKSYADTAVSTHSSDTTNIHGISDTSILITTSGTQTLTNKTISGSDNTITNIANGSLTNSSITINGSPVSLGGSVTIDALPSQTGQSGKYLTTDGSVASWAVVDLSSKADLSGATFTGSVEIDQNLTVDGNLTVNGTTFNVSSTSIVIEDNMVQLAHQNAANTVDLGIVVAYTDGTAKHAGLVRDVSAGKWKLFKDVTDEPATTVNFSQGSLDTLAIGSLELDTALAIAEGGTGGTTAEEARNNILPTQTSNSGKFLTTDGTSVSWAQATMASEAVSSNITLAKNTKYFVDTTAARTLTLPATPSLGDEVYIFDASNSAGVYNITISRNGEKINGNTGNLIFNVNGGSVALVYTGSTYGWRAA